MYRAVTRNRTTTIKSGTTAHASSICVLPYTCAGSTCGFAGRRPKPDERVDGKARDDQEGGGRDGENDERQVANGECRSRDRREDARRLDRRHALSSSVCSVAND